MDRNGFIREKWMFKTHIIGKPRIYENNIIEFQKLDCLLKKCMLHYLFELSGVFSSTNSYVKSLNSNCKNVENLMESKVLYEQLIHIYMTMV